LAPLYSFKYSTVWYNKLQLSHIGGVGCEENCSGAAGNYASSFILCGVLPVNAANFSDVPKTHQYYKYINKLADAGIVKGRSATQYAPDATLNRAELATLLVNLKKLPLETSKQYFKDVPKGTWYYGYVNAAAKAGFHLRFLL